MENQHRGQTDRSTIEMQDDSHRESRMNGKSPGQCKTTQPENWTPADKETGKTIGRG